MAYSHKAVDRAAVVDNLEMPRAVSGDGITLAQPGPEHTPAYQKLYGDPSSKFIGGPVDAGGAWQRLATDTGHWRINGFGRYVILDDHGEMVGFCGLWFPHDKPEVEVAYGVMPGMRGRGIATRAARLVAGVAERRGVPTLVSYIAVQNEPSKRVAAAAGASLDGHCDMAGKPHEVWRYVVDARQVKGEPVLLEATVMPLNIRTARLALTQCRSDHFERYAVFLADPHSLATMGGPATPYEAARSMLAAAGHWALRGHGLYAVEYDGALAGFVGLARPHGAREIELAYHLLPEARGKGFATEAARAVLWAAAEQGLSQVYSAVHGDNAASLRVVSSLGAVADGTVIADGREAIRFVHNLSADRPTPKAISA
ncbi:MAG: GNAT family N-acetyltransferase [Pseudomonadota bacterium]